MIEFRNKIYVGSNNRKSLFDCKIPLSVKSVVIFIHGYKGYKDWGAWNLLEDYLVSLGYGFVKFNTTHNGGTIENPIDFDDLEAFGNNTYSKELFDLDIIISETSRMIREELALEIPIYLLGHSRGGGIAILQGAKDERISKIISLAGICDIESRFPTGDDLAEWEREGVRFVANARTNQAMPHYFSFYQDFIENKNKLNIEKAARSLKIPFLQIHGDMDTSVSISEGQNIADWTTTALCIIKGADHTFGAVQPWDQHVLPTDLKIAADKMSVFFSE